MAKTKTFPHAVIYNGVFYPANTEIKVAEEKATVDITVDKAVDETVAKPKPKKAVKKNDNEGTV